MKRSEQKWRVERRRRRMGEEGKRGYGSKEGLERKGKGGRDRKGNGER